MPDGESLNKKDILIKETKTNNNQKPKCYVLDMFPYPSGEGLHMGHVKTYTASDVYARLKRLKGFDVLHPTGFDAFGLPAEQYALKNKINPKISTEKNCNNFLRQMKELHLDYDYDKVFSTTDPEFYKWTQWIFKQMYKKGLAFQSYEPINWCPSCKTGLANEDLEGNVCERCGTLVEKKPLRQWVLEITRYADRLVDDLDKLAWPEWLKDLQRNWIGRSEGSEIDFKLVSKDNNFNSSFIIFTTRADTLFGCTYTVLAPEHKLVNDLLDDKDNLNILKNKEEVRTYINEVKQKSDIERSAEGKEKTGVRLEGVMAINPANGEEVPVFIADYVLASYGTGAIMAVPAHDERDKEFAEKFAIEIKEINVVNTEEERKRITDIVGGKLVKKYKLRDWVFARQRYWGEPFPIVFATDESGNADYDKSYIVADSELPILLPDVESYEPTGTGESPLANIKEFTDVYGFINGENEFVSCDKEDSKARLFKRETNTMPQWAGSSWYWLRFMDTKNNNEIFSKEAMLKWGQVDKYVGGAEHATRHLIYGRFWHKFLFDLGLINFDEPFKEVDCVGLLLGEGGVKMSKRLGNIINPDDIIREYGADVARMYVMFMGPFSQASAWDSKALMGSKRFLDRVERLKDKINEPCKNKNIIHQTIKKVGEDIEGFKFNTAISQMMIALNEFEQNGISKDEYQKLLIALNPFAPIITEKILEEVFGAEDIKSLSWPEYDETKLSSDTVNIAVQIGGKMRGIIEAKRDSDDNEIENIFKSSDIYKKYIELENKEIKKIIIVKNKIINVVI